MEQLNLTPQLFEFSPLLSFRFLQHKFEKWNIFRNPKSKGKKKGDSSARIDVEKLISFSDYLIAVLKDTRDANSLTHCLELSKSLKSSSDAEFNDSKTLIEDYEKKIEECKKKKGEDKIGSCFRCRNGDPSPGIGSGAWKRTFPNGGAQIIVNNEINDLECQRISFKEKKQYLKKQEKDDLRALWMLSMYASLTNIIPGLDDHSKISGHIVDRDNKAVEKFEFDPTKISSCETCQSIWEMINQQ